MELKTTKLLFTVIYLAIGTNFCAECPMPDNEQEETEIIQDYLVQPSTTQEMNFQRTRSVTFTNTSTCYVFHISKVGYQYLMPWSSKPQAKIQSVSIAVPPNGSVEAEVAVPLGAQLLSVYSIRDGTLVETQSR